MIKTEVRFIAYGKAGDDMKRLYILLVTIIDIVLLAVILKSYFAEKNAQKPTAQSSSGAAVSQSSDSRTTGTQTTQTTQSTGSVTQQTEAVSDTAATTKASSGKQNYSTDAYAQYADMGDTFLNGSSGFVWQNLNGSAVKLTDFSAVQGGWKAYIVSSPDDVEHSVTYLMNIKLSGTPEKVTVTLDWDYFYVNYSGDEGHSSEEDSVYTGPWTSVGTVYAEGAGAVSLYEFDEQDGRQYGLGTVFWPDSTYGAIALVRP
jgi:hypothetical protein